MSYRPRGALARALYDKLHSDDFINSYDMRQWYELSRLLPAKYQNKFVKIEEPDPTTLQWIHEAKEMSGRFWLQIWHLVARMFLGCFMTQTSVNGLLKRGSMFILSEMQFARLLISGGFNPETYSSRKLVSVLDIGAGDGEVTLRMIRAIHNVCPDIQINAYATEDSWTMKDRLMEKNFRVVNKLENCKDVDLIACLNVLDRCVNPQQLMKDIYDSLAPDGRVLVALVLPYSHFVETNTTHMPVQPLLPYWPSKTNLTFDFEASSFFDQLEMMGFNIEAWTRAPYLCQGDLRQSFYWLIDVVVVLSKNNNFHS